jgi:hypothetical protein
VGFALGAAAGTFKHDKANNYIFSTVDTHLALAQNNTAQHVFLANATSSDKAISFLQCTASSAGVLSCNDGAMSAFTTTAANPGYYLSMTSVASSLSLKVVSA